MARSILGHRIRERRRAIGITQADLARRVGISPSYLNLIERNRRGIAGKRLADIAEALGIRLSELEGASERRLEQALAALAADPRFAGLEIEAEAVGELIGRFPGWARAIGALARSEEEQAALLRSFADRLTHDPFLGETVHRMLTRIAALRSTAEILEAVPDISPGQARRFHTILAEESRRLSDIAEALATYFDKAATPERAVTPVDEVQALFEDHANRFDAIEAALAGAPEAPTAEAAHRLAALRAGPVVDRLVAEADGIATAEARARAAGALTAYAEDAARAPLARFAPLAEATGYDLERIVAETGLPQDLVCRRMTALADAEGRPRFGYVAANASGAILELRGIPGFHPVRHAAHCALWALARAQFAPGQAVAQLAAFPSGRRFFFLARTRRVGTVAHGRPQQFETDMLVIDERALADTVYARAAPAAEEVGVTCRLCPRKGCAHRVEDPLTGPPTAPPGAARPAGLTHGEDSRPAMN